ncbi:MAG: hypothetical protein KatS3mg105_4923 [Gemmatales bacterium]|nr:MAG: hypothetical protein KatS3mg105_4923 [Gemmatales bacterium]
MSDHSKRDFDLMTEYARGCLYRGGEDMQYFLAGYAWGWILGIAFVVGLSVLGLILGS